MGMVLTLPCAPPMKIYDRKLYGPKFWLYKLCVSGHGLILDLFFCFILGWVMICPTPDIQNLTNYCSILQLDIHAFVQYKELLLLCPGEDQNPS